MLIKAISWDACFDKYEALFEDDAESNVLLKEE